MTIQRVIATLLTLLALAEIFGIMFTVGPWHYVETICCLRVNGTLVGVRHVSGKLVMPLNPLFFLVNGSLNMQNLCSGNNTLSINKMIVTCSCCKLVIDSSRVVFSNIVIGLVLLGSLWTMVRRSEFEVL